MAVFSSIAATLAAVSAVTGVAGATVSYLGQRKAAAGEERAEAIRKRQMDLAAARDRRATIRQAVIARAQATSNAAAQGASDGSGLQGGLGQITNMQNQNIANINQGQALGTQMFGAQRQISSGQTMSSIGQSIQNFGSMIADNYSRFERVYNNAAG